MSTNKQALFNEEVQSIATLAKALAHPARISILQYLASKNECICNDIVTELPLAQSTISQHLKELKKVNLIKGEINGPKTCYCINWDGIQKIKTIFNILFIDIENEYQSNCC